MTSTEIATGEGLIPILEDQVLRLADHEAWLDAQIRELEYANSIEDAQSIQQPDENLSAEEKRSDLDKRIDLLKKELATATCMESVRAMIIESAHSYQVVLKGLFKNEHEVEEKSLIELIEERDDAVTKYLGIHRELQQVRRELATTQSQVLDYQDENRRLAQLLSEETAAMKEAAASQDSGSNRRMAQRIEEELKNINIKHNVISNVLQGLLLESGVDWANDPHYLDVMLKLKRSSE